MLLYCPRACTAHTPPPPTPTYTSRAGPCGLLQEVAGCDVSAELEAVFSEALSDYPAPELRWLAELHDAKLKQRAAAGQGSTLSMELVLDFLRMNEEVGTGLGWL